MTQEERKIIRNIQKDALFWILRGLRTKSVTRDYVKDFASETLQSTRKTTLEECFERLYEAAEKFWEANEVFVKNARDYYVMIAGIRLANGRKYMSEKDINNAVIALRGGEN